MYNFDHDEEEPNVEDLVGQYESMLSEGNTVFLDEESFLYLIDHYSGDMNKALEVIEHALAQYPFSGSFYLQKAQLLINKEATAESFELTEEALAQAKLFNPNDIEVLLLELDLLELTKQYDAALELLEYSYQYADSSEIQTLNITKVDLLKYKGERDAALNFLWSLLWENPRNKMVSARLEEQMYFSRNPEKFIKPYKEVLDKDPYAYGLWYSLGNTYYKTKDPESAIEAYEYAIITNEKFEYAYIDCIDCLCKMKNYSRALQHLEDFAKHFELDDTTLSFFGNCYEGLEDYAKARSYYAKAAQDDPIPLDGVVIHFRIGICYAKEGLQKQACNAFEEAYNIGMEYLCSRLEEVSDECEGLENFEKAHNFYMRSLSIKPGKSHLWLTYLRFLFEEELYIPALEFIEEARKYGQSSELDYAEAAFFFQIGSRQEGLALLIQALAENKEFHQTLFFVAPKLEKDGDVMTLVANDAELF